VSEHPPVTPDADGEPAAYQSEARTGADAAATDAADTRPDRRRRRRGGFWHRHRALAALLALIGLIVAGVAGFGVFLNKQVSDIGRVVAAPEEGKRPPAVPVDVTNPQGPATVPPNGGSGITILLAGADNGDDGSSIAESVRAGRWKPGQHRSDTIMVLHISGDRQRVYVVSIPRDTFTAIDGHGSTKINAAFSYGGPQLMQLTVEQFAGIRMDHLAIIDWNGFRDVSTALGGVTVYVAEDMYDPMHKYSWKKGPHTLMGDEALEYVRTRYGLQNGDFDRIQRQQNFLREMLRKLVSKGTLTNPMTLADAVSAVTKNLVLDEGFSDGDIRSLAWQMRDIRVENVTFLTVPITSYGTEGGASVLYADRQKTQELFYALWADRMPEFLAANPGLTQLKAPDQVR